MNCGGGNRLLQDKLLVLEWLHLSYVQTISEKVLRVTWCFYHQTLYTTTCPDMLQKALVTITSFESAVSEGRLIPTNVLLLHFWKSA